MRCAKDGSPAGGISRHRPELGTRPRVRYRNLHRITKCFIGGSVERQADGAVNCVGAASVTLKRGKVAIAAVLSDAFGDFLFDGLEPESGEYMVEVAHEGRVARMSVHLGESASIGSMRLEAPDDASGRQTEES